MHKKDIGITLNGDGDEESNRKWRWQMCMFIITYSSYSTLHFIRQGWAI